MPAGFMRCPASRQLAISTNTSSTITAATAPSTPPASYPWGRSKISAVPGESPRKSGMHFEAEAFEQAVKRRPADAQKLGGARQIAAALRQRHLNDAAFGTRPRLAQIERAEGQFGRCELEVRRRDRSAFGHHHRPLHAVFQLAHITAPRMNSDGGECVGGEALDVAVDLLVEFLQEEIGERHRITFALAPRRHVHTYLVQAIIQIL